MVTLSNTNSLHMPIFDDKHPKTVQSPHQQGHQRTLRSHDASATQEAAVGADAVSHQATTAHARRTVANK